MGARIFVGVIVGVAFRISQDFIGPAELILATPRLGSVFADCRVLVGGIWLVRRRAQRAAQSKLAKAANVRSLVIANHAWEAI